MEATAAGAARTMLDLPGPDRLLPVGGEHAREVERRVVGAEELAVLLDDGRGGEPLVVALPRASSGALPQLRVRGDLAEPCRELLDVAEGDDVPAGAVLDRLARAEVEVVGDGGASLVHRLQQRVREALGERGHQHDVRGGVDVVLGAEAGHVHAAPEVEGVHELADGDVVGVVAVDVPPQREADGLVLDQRQRPHRVELVLAVLEGGGQGDVHALVLDALDRPRPLPGEVRNEHHVLVGEGRDELLAQSVGDRLQTVDDVAGRHQRVPELRMVEVVAVDLQDGAGAACVPAERVLEGEGLHRGGENDRVLLRERVVELP